MNKLIHLLLAVLLLMVVFMISVQPSRAAVMSSQTAVVGATPSILIMKGQSVKYIIESTGAVAGIHMATVAVQYSFKGSNWVTEITTAPSAHAGWMVSDILPPKEKDAYYRFNVLRTSQSALTLTLMDIEGVVSTIKNNKRTDIVDIYDDSIRIHGSLWSNKYTLQRSSGGLEIYLDTSTQLRYGPQIPIDKRWGKTVVEVDKYWSVIRNTGTDAFDCTLGSLPTISTYGVTNGEKLFFTSNFSSVTFKDSSTLVGTGLLLGAATRTLGKSDSIEFMFLDGYWREINFTNVLYNQP